MSTSRTSSSRLTIIVAAHKPCAFPLDSGYLPVQAGAALYNPLDIQRDDDGISISEKNPWYCELTALYWAWKNLPSDALGLMHYRRYLGRGRCVAGSAELAAMLERTPVILPRKRRYWIASGESQYTHAHGCESLQALRRVMRRHQPDYLPAFEASLRSSSGHRFNMFVMRRPLLDAYCEWLFGLLLALEQEEPAICFPRIYGFLSERMLDCWLVRNRIPYLELPVIYTEPQNWLRKGAVFLYRQYCGQKREASAPASSRRKGNF